MKITSVVQAVKEFNRRRRLAELAKSLGTFKDFMTPEDHHEMRNKMHSHKQKKEVASYLPYSGPAKTLEDMEEAIKKGAKKTK